MSVIITDFQDKVISKSHNLSQLRRYASKIGVSTVGVQRGSFEDVASGTGGTLFVKFFNGSRCRVKFARYKTLCRTVLLWRSLYGATLRINDVRCGTVSRDNKRLIEELKDSI